MTSTTLQDNSLHLLFTHLNPLNRSHDLCVRVCGVQKAIFQGWAFPPQAFAEALLEPACQAFWRPADSKLKGDWSRLALEGRGRTLRQRGFGERENCGGFWDNTGLQNALKADAAG